MAEEKKKKSGIGKILIVLFIVIIIIPTAILVGFYFMNQDFQFGMNRVLSGAPVVGSYFEQIPTRQEKDDQIKSIAQYMLDIEQVRAVDKLILIKNDELELYDNVIKNMLRINPNGTRYIIEEIRKATVKKDVISNTLDQIEEEKSGDITNTSTYIDGLNDVVALEEMNKIIEGSINGYRSLAKIMEKIDDKRAAELIWLLENPNMVLDNMTDAKKNAIIVAKADIDNRKSELANITEIYETESTEKLFEVLGNIETYPMDELAYIFKNLGVVKAGKVLSKGVDDEFTYQLINEMKENEVIENGEDKVTKDILKTIKIYSQFDDNISELSKVYEKMSVAKVSAVLSKMFRNGNEAEMYVLDGGETIAISEEYLALKVLETFDEKKKSEILSIMDNTLATEITKMMALPQFD